MGTGSLTIITNENNEEICVMYTQFDGYLSGVGKELANLLAEKTIVNGFGSDTNVANGFNCLAAQIIGAFKDRVGNVYLYPAGTRNCGEEYTYFISGGIGREACIKAQEYDDVIFDGTSSDFKTLIDNL